MKWDTFLWHDSEKFVWMSLGLEFLQRPRVYFVIKNEQSIPSTGYHLVVLFGSNERMPKRLKDKISIALLKNDILFDQGFSLQGLR
jgi:hypothetical protein